MKNLGIKTKNIVRKITAIASAALMTGLSMGVAAADLSSLTNTFIANGELNAYVVLGTGGATNVVGFAKDVAGAVVVASAFAQKAITATSSSGTAVLERNITTGYINSTARAQSFPLWDGKSVAKYWDNAATGFSWLPNQTVSNSTGVIGNMTGKLVVQDYTTGYGIKTTEAGKVRLTDKSIIYNLTFQDFVSGYSGVGKNTTGIVLPSGGTYKITGWTTDGTYERITLGDFNEVKATTGSSYAIGASGATFEITGHSSDPAALKIKVSGSDGTTLFHDYVSAGDEIYKNSEFALNLVKYYTPGGVVDATIEWSSGVLTLEDGNKSVGIPGGENWTVSVGLAGAYGAECNDTRNISWIAWEYDAPADSSYLDLSPSSSLDFFGGYFKLTVDALEINSTEKKEATITLKNKNSEEEIRFNDENGTLARLDISPIAGITVTGTSAPFEKDFSWYLGNSSTPSSFKVTCNNDNPATFNLTRGSQVLADLANATAFKMDKTTALNMPFEIHAIAEMYGNSSANCAGMKFNLTVLNATFDAGVPLYQNLSWIGANTATPVAMDYTDGTLNLTEGANRVQITMDNGTISVIDYYSGSSNYGDNIKSSGDMYYTEYGTKLVRTSSTELAIYYPDSTRVAKVSIGRSGIKEYNLSSDEYESELDVTLKSAGGSSERVNKIDVGLAKLDSEITSSSLDKPVILMGGWAVNSLVGTLADAGSINKSDLAADRALVQLVSSAFNSKDALVIAGWTGDDTRRAAQVVASEVLGSSIVGLTGSKAILNTGVTSYSDVTLV